MSAPRMGMSTDFLGAFAKLPSQQQRAVRTMIARFGRDSHGSGLNYEHIQNAKDAKMRSLRIDKAYRAIVLKPDKGNVHMLLWADKHDEAYDWATRHVCSINEETGALQVYQPEQATPGQSALSIPATATPSPFASLKPRELVRLGVPHDMVREVHRIASEAVLEEIQPRLPVEAYESLYLYMAGESYEELVLARETPSAPVDPDDFAAALDRDDSRARFVVVKDDLELEAMFNAPLERWRVFLHSSQRRLVERRWNGPVRVLGGAGTGKTVVAMHRARWLAQHVEEGERILFTTFTRNLAADIENNLRSICSPEEMDRIEVVNLDSWVVRFLRGRRIEFRVVFDDRDVWGETLAMKTPDLAFSDAFFRDEWALVVQANGVTTRDGYLSARRTGRGVRLNRAARARIWPVFEEYRAQLTERGMMELADCYRAATALLTEDRSGANFGAVIVDEAQDMTAPAWRLIRALAPPGKNDLFIVGDAHQRIYSRAPVVLGRCGIDIRGRGRKLRLNYRTTEETRRWAAGVLAAHGFDDMDGGSDDDARVRSVAHGPEPRVEHFDDRAGQTSWLVRYLTELREQGEALRGVCVVARTREECRTIGLQLAAAEVPHEILSGDRRDESSEGVRVATMHRVKGLEFDRMVIATVNRGVVPLRHVVHAADESERSAVEVGERSLLYVAATRAKKELVVLSYGEASPFVP